MRIASALVSAVRVTCLSAVLAGSAAAQSAFDSTLFRTFQWRNVGPFRGGRATTAVGVPSNPRLYYMGATGGGVWETVDAGASWRNISDGFFQTGSVGDIAVADANPSVIYVGMGEAPVRGQMSSYGDGVYKSIDAGKTWKHVGLEATRQISRVIIHPTDPNLVYVAAQGSPWGPSDDRGIYRSSDGGATWKRIFFVSPNAGPSELVMDPTNPRVLYAAFWEFQRTPWAIRSGGPSSGIWKSTDGGDTWTQLKAGLPSLMGKIRLGVAPSNPNRVYAAIEADSGGLYRSEDAGATWRRVSGSHGITTRPWYYMGVTVDRRSADVVYVMGSVVLKSTDGGVTFASVTVPHSDTHTLWINPTNSQQMVVTNDGGAAVSLNGGGSWSSEDNQPTAQFYAVQADDLFPYNLYGGQQDAGSVDVPSRSFLDAGGAPRNFKAVGGGETARFAFDPKNPRIVFATGYLGVVDRHDNVTGLDRSVSEWPGGQHLGVTASEMPYRFNWSAPLLASRFDPKVMYHGGNVLFRSADEGTTWIPISPDLTRDDKAHQGRSEPFWHDGSGGEIYNTIFTIAESPLERTAIWVGTDDGLVQLTRDSGKTWKNVTPAGWGEGLVYNIDVSPHDNATAYVAFSRRKWNDNTPHFYKTTDYGKSWTDLAVSLPRGDPARVLREDPVRKNLLYAATENALWISFDGGSRWQSFQRNMPVVPISDLLIHHDDLLAATEGRGFWILDDITPLRELTPRAASAQLFLFKPRPAYRLAGSGRGGAASRAVVHYILGGPIGRADTLRLEIRDARGAVIARSTSAADTAGPASGPSTQSGRAGGGGRGGGRGGRTGAPIRLSALPGINQFSWDLRATTGEGVVQLAPSGRYEVRLSRGSTTVSQPLEIIPDPRTSSTPASELAHSQLARELFVQAAEMSRELAVLNDVHRQARAVVDGPTGHDAELQGLLKRLDSLENAFVPRGYTSDIGAQDPLNSGLGLSNETSTTANEIDGASGPVTRGQRERVAELRAQWNKLHAACEQALTAVRRKMK